MELSRSSYSTQGLSSKQNGFFNIRTNRTVAKRIRNFNQAYQSWLVPYFKSRVSAAFRPVLSFLYTDLNCNLNCSYCYSRGRDIPGMTMTVARDAVDWLNSRGCRVLAYMGGEPLVRPDFIIDLTRYAVQKGFFVYLPTNGILMNQAFIDEIGRAGVATINLAVDALKPRSGLVKAFNRIQPQFEYLVEREKHYGFITFLNINITRHNIEDVMALTEMARDYGIATDYHINEPPLITYDGYKNADKGGWITPKELQHVDDLIDWLVEKNQQGYLMVNSVEHLNSMKRFIRNELPSWSCRAGELSMVIRLDGSFVPCFEFYASDEDWGNIYEGAKFNRQKLAEMKQMCSRRCLSTCNYQTNHYASSVRNAFQWLAKHAASHVFGVS